MTHMCVHESFSGEKLPWLSWEPQSGSVTHQRLRTSNLECPLSGAECVELSRESATPCHVGPALSQPSRSWGSEM